MPGLFSRLKSKESSRKKRNADIHADQIPPKPSWTDAWTRKTVQPEEVDELLKVCTSELKSRGLDQPFLLLPYRPNSDPSAVRTFIRNFFHPGGEHMTGERLIQELRMTEPMVISGVAKWCWSRLQGGVVGWDAYELFKIGEGDSSMARDSFKTFIPISVESDARQRIIFDFFDLLAAVAAHGKKNGLPGRKLSRMAAWWAFEPKAATAGFENGYKAWLSAADATSHLFFAFLRALSSDQNITAISILPTSLQKLLQETEYPPETPELMMTKTSKVVMIVDTVSPTPFALLRRANHFEYRDTDKALQQFTSVDDPIQALSEECRRVLKSISAANQSQVSSSKYSTSLRDASWSRFEDVGFSSPLEEEEDDESAFTQRKHTEPEGLRNYASSGGPNGNGSAFDRPTTPSWADFLSSGFVDDGSSRSNLLLPHDKVLPPLNTEPRQRSSQSHRPRPESDSQLQPGELASITVFDLDETFWWVWITSLAPEETPERKSAFGRCAVVETKIRGGRWLIMEEQVAGAAPEPEEGAYIAEKKGFLSWTKSIGRRKSTGKQALDRSEKNFSSFSVDKASPGPDAQAKILAAQLRAQDSQQKLSTPPSATLPSGEGIHEKMESAQQSNIGGEATSAMKWAKKFDKGATTDAYMANSNAGKGQALSFEDESNKSNGNANGKRSENFADYDTMTTPPIKIKDAPLPETPKQQPADHVESEKVEEPSPQPLNHEPPTPQEQSSRPSDDPPTQARPVLAEPAVVVPAAENLSNGMQREPKKPSGLKKLFSRKNRGSMLPQSRSSSKLVDVTAGSQELSNPPGPPAPVLEMEEEETKEEDGSKANENNEPTFDPEMSDNLPIDPNDAANANREFSRFDQGPLEDQPAFDGEDEEDDPDDATPPPISRKPLPKHAIETPEEKLTGSAGPGVKDRWAQIRKNAAERAAQRQAEEQIKHGISRTATGEPDDEGEETIESRVARIKARVAELTGNMEAGSPQKPSPARSPEVNSPPQPLSPERKPKEHVETTSSSSP